MRKIVLSLVMTFCMTASLAQNIWKEPAATNLPNGNWRNEQSGEWEIGLYDDCAVYDSRLWQYKVRKDRKVLLTDGSEDIVIALGKEKDGRRSISVNGRKQLYSRITSRYLPDYPAADETPFNAELAECEAPFSILNWEYSQLRIFPIKNIPNKGRNQIKPPHSFGVSATLHYLCTV